ncbi:hypothetical protein [Streptomyces cylindrosporus]|uniref:Lipoprotein n=1 Tax=Streptomyces cylindrosporus TaxID=2927583 RepID=A0ABS9YC42_9ACTN|nr:hypothetical protein [Streptomyces cylindrosporus]MCI3274798.1 hypothetical protein [Streptomyces cylindrosporus]
MNRHLRKAVVVTAAISAGVLMTACQSSSSNSGTSSTGQHQSTSKASGKTSSKTSGTAGKTTTSQRTSSGTTAQNASNASKSGQGVTGSFTGGTVSYLAPGKYIVSVPGRTDQIFFVADDTRVNGAGAICGSGQCTLDQLETATRKAAVSADVTLKQGIATLVSERASTGSGAKGVNGTWFGQVSYLAPGKFTVSGPKGAEQAFFIADDTVIKGYGTICGSSASAAVCTLDQLEAAAKKGLDAEVVLANGIATSVTEDH